MDNPDFGSGCCRKLIPVMDKNADGIVTEEELKDHILFMQKRYVQNDVDRTWENYDKTKLTGDLLSWDVYREMVYGQHRKSRFACYPQSTAVPLNREMLMSRGPVV